MKRKLANLLAMGALLGSMLFVTGGVALAANQAANLDQCANDPAPSPPTNGCAGVAGETGWVNGNLGASKSIYREGDSISYRMRFTNLATTGPAHTVVIEWDTTKAGKHAIDYLTTWNRTVSNANPCLGVSLCVLGSPSSQVAIPADGQVTGAGVTPVAGLFTMWGGTITNISPYSYPDGMGFAGDKTARLTISFTASRANPVLAWGGHIATRQDWPGASAVNISGSPYHMRLIDLDGAGGNQDRSLSADAVVFPGSITVIKNATPDGNTVFPFTASPSPLTAFNLVDDGTAANYTQVFSGLTSFVQYTIAETKPDGWDLNSRGCTVANPNGGSTGLSGTTGVTVTLREGEDWTCTFANGVTPAPALSVTKVDDGDTYDSVGDVIDYTITVANTGNVTLTNVVVTDTNAVDLDCDGTLGAPFTTTIASIGVGGSVECTARHVVTQADIEAGSYLNEACADDGAGGAASDCGDVTTPGSKNPALNIVKSATETSVDGADDVINYVITVANTGNVTLTNVVVTDPFADPGSIVRDATDVVGDEDNLLEVGETWGYTAKHTVTQAEIDAGGNCDGDDEGTAFDALCNTATADSDETGPDTDDAVVPVTRNPDLSIAKDDDYAVGQKFANVGDVINYQIIVTNEGNTTLINVTVTDPNAANLDCDTDTVGNQASGFTIPVGGTLTCSASHTITQADLDAGFYLNTACADDGEGEALEACDDVNTPGKNQPTIVTEDVLIPQDSIAISGLTADATGELYVELRINEDCAEDETPAYSKTWDSEYPADGDALFTGNGTYETDNTVAVSSDATIRWCTSYSGDANNAARPLDDRGEVVSVDFDPVLTGVAIGFAIPLVAWAIWRRRQAVAI